MLSMPTIQAETGARPVLIYRHPGAMLVSYRRMQWLPDVDELAPIVDRIKSSDPDVAELIPRLPQGTSPGGVLAMAWFWSALYAIAAADAVSISGCVIVSHEMVATDEHACRQLHDRLGVPWNKRAEAEFRRDQVGSVDPGKLHNFDRRPADAATAWRGRLSDLEIAELEDATAPVRAMLDNAALHLHGQ